MAFRTSKVSLLCVILAWLVCFAVAARDGPESPLPDADHYDDGTHNVEFDHEAFLGGEVGDAVCT